MNLSKHKHILFLLAVIAICLVTEPCWAQSGLEGRITQIIGALVRIVNVMIIGFVVWAGFLIAKGDHSGFHRLIYSIVGLVVANGAYMIINFFA